MRLAFILFHYFPHGGLQRDFFRIAKACHEQGNSIDIYCMKWLGEKPAWANIYLIEAKGLTNHSRSAHFAAAAQSAVQQKSYDSIIGFNKMPGLDFYFAADGCLAGKAKLLHYPFLKWLPRYRTYLKLEAAVFNANNKTKILSISSIEKAIYQKVYQTPESRFIELPPGIDINRIPPNDVNIIRSRYRASFNIQPTDNVLLSVGSNFNTKGIDRALYAFAALPKIIQERSYYFVAGKEKHLNRYQQLAKKLNIAGRINFLGARDDIPQLLWMSDLLLQVSRTENTGTAIVEALAAHVPVIATENCGYASYVTKNQAGHVIPEPFNQTNLNLSLLNILEQGQPKLSAISLALLSKVDFTKMVDEAVNAIIASQDVSVPRYHADSYHQ